MLNRRYIINIFLI